MRVVSQVGGFLSLLFSAEVAASWWIWGRAPSDSIGVEYRRFWAFEASRLHYWLLVCASLVTLWIVSWYALRRHVHFMTSWPLAVVLGIGLEVLTSLLYWGSADASHLRSFFQSGWWWDRVPQASDLGWPSFRIYLWAHLVPWAVVLLLGMILWLRRAKGGTKRELHPGTRKT